MPIVTVTIVTITVTATVTVIVIITDADTDAYVDADANADANANANANANVYADCLGRVSDHGWQVSLTLLVALPAAIAAAAVLGRSRYVVIASVQAMSALSVVVPANANADCLGRVSDYGWPVSLTLLVGTNSYVETPVM